MLNNFVQKTPVIIDTDPGVDDVVAILLALASPELSILAYIVSFGNTDLDSSYLNILKVYNQVALQLEHFPSHRQRFHDFPPQVKPILARGSRGPLQGDLHSAQYFHGRDGLGNIATRHPDLSTSCNLLAESHPHLNISKKSGVDVILDLVRQHPARSITYIALGPLTNLALAMAKDAELICSKIGRIVCMGGALDVPGNTSPVAEFNFFADPFAVKSLLLTEGSPQKLPLDRCYILPLDITTPHELPFPVYKDRVDSTFESFGSPSTPIGKQPIVHFTSSFLETTREVMLQFGKDAMELHDIAAVWFAIENPPSIANALSPGWQTKARVFDIECIGELTRGMLVVDRRDDASAYMLGANRAQAQEVLEKSQALSRDPPNPATTSIHPGVDCNNLKLIESQGVLCVCASPGPDVLLDLLLKRVWGVE